MFSFVINSQQITHCSVFHTHVVGKWQWQYQVGNTSFRKVKQLGPWLALA